VSALVIGGVAAVGFAGEAFAGRGDGQPGGEGRGAAAATHQESRTPSTQRDGTGKGYGAQATNRADDRNGSPADNRTGHRNGSQAQDRSGNGAGSGTAPAWSELEVILQRALVDEVGALAAYESFIDAFGAVDPFVDIAAAEERHVAAIERVADRTGVDLDAVTPPAITAPDTVAEACAMVADVEQAGIDLYDELLPQVQDWPNVVRMFTNLQAASERHLGAVTECR